MTLSSIKQRLKAATPGPWTKHEHIKDADGNHSIAIPCAIMRARGMPSNAQIDASMREGSANAEFIVHAPEDIEALVACVEVMREALEGMLNAHKCGCEPISLGGWTCPSHEALAACDKILGEK
jgi:hypothetical protein